MGTTVSYSQYAAHSECPFKYKRRYVDGNYIAVPNIHAIFGTAMHETIQEWLIILYGKSQIAANEMDYITYLKDRMSANFLEAKKKLKEGYPATREEMVEFWKQGVETLEWLRKPKNRIKYYALKGWRLHGIEILLEVDVRPNVTYKGYLDIVLTNGKKYKIIDLKTSTKGWGKWAKKDKLKNQQLVLYKKLYAEKLGVPLEDIDIEFHILKRKLWEDIEFVQPRVQRWTPSHGIVSTNRAYKDFMEFVDRVFDEDGNRRTDIEYPKTPGEYTCRFCEFSDPALGLCDQTAD